MTGVCDRVSRGFQVLGELLPSGRVPLTERLRHMMTNSYRDIGNIKEGELHEQRSRCRLFVRTAGLMLAASGLASLVAVGTAGAATRTVVSSTKTAGLGKILVSGKTLYTLKPSKTPCAAECLKFWPELLLPKGATGATAGPGVKAANLGTVKRSGGSLQVTYSGKPLYFFAGDTGPGQVNGNVTDQWGKWSTVGTTRTAGSNSSSSSNSGSSSAGTGGVSF
jgi:predicted lipoprotein with Yx(FWY)xxD motif